MSTMPALDSGVILALFMGFGFCCKLVFVVAAVSVFWSITPPFLTVPPEGFGQTIYVPPCLIIVCFDNFREHRALVSVTFATKPVRFLS